MKKLCHCIGPLLLLLVVLVASGGCTKGARAHRLLKHGNQEFEAENYDDAEVTYKNVLALDRLNPTAIGQLGRIYAKEGRISEAGMYLLKATELEPNSLALQLALGQVYVAYRDSTNAAKIAMRILTAQPTNEEALVLLINSAIPVAELKQQMDSLPRLSQNPAYHVAVGLRELREQNLSAAAEELRQALAAAPKSSQTYYALAQLHFLQKENDAAVDALQNAAAFAPLRSPIRIKYIDYLIQKGSVDEARKILKDMTGKAPDYVPGWATLLNLAVSQKQYDEASHLTDTILARDDKNYDALLARGSVSLATGDTAKAVMQFERMETMYKKSPQVAYELALAYLMSRDRIKCVASLNQALALDPVYTQAALLSAQLDIRTGDAGAAVALLTRFVKKAPNVGQAQLLLADAYLAEQKPESALAIYHSLAEALPKNPQIPLLTGIVLAGQRRISEARIAFEKALDLAPDFLPAVEQLISLDLAERKFNDATALAEDQISKSPKAAQPWEILAKIDAAQTNFPAAETALLKAIELNPDLPSPYLLLAQVYVNGTNYQQALQKLNALVARTNDAPAYLQIGAIHEVLKDYDKARQAYEKVLAVNPNSIPALNNLSYIYAVRLPDIDRAYNLAQKARDLLPYDPNVQDTLGWVLFEKGDYPRALALLEDSAERSPADAEIQFHLGMTHYMMDEEDAARAALQKALATKQDYVNKDQAKSALAVLEMKTAGADASVLAQLEKALQAHPKDPVILNRIGTLQERAGLAEKAAGTYETALKQNPDAVHIMAKLARLYAARLNQPDKALALATDAHKLAPDSADVNGVLGRLVFRNGSDYLWAVTLLENAVDRVPDQPELLYDLAWAYYGVGRIADAQTMMQKAMQSGGALVERDDAKNFVALTGALVNPSKMQAAAAQARAILQSDLKYVPALMIDGVTQERAGDFKAAQDDYDRALKALPQFSPATRLLAILDSKYFDTDPGAYAAAEKARNAYPEDPEVTKALGILSYRQTQFNRSAELLQEDIGKGKDDGELYYYLGMDYYQLKRMKESKQALGRALSLKLPENLAADARRTLADIQ